MRNLEVFLIIIFQSVISNIWAGYIQDKLIDRKAIKMVRVGPCPRTNLPFQYFAQFGKTSLQTALITNATALAREDLQDKLKLTITITRCGSRENLDSCEDYHKFRNIDYCQSISTDDMIRDAVNPLIIPFKPKLRCPIKKGVYTALNFTFNVSPFLMFNIDGWYWKFNIEVNSPKENNRLIGCVVAEGYTKL